jgi:hypothetical protein
MHRSSPLSTLKLRIAAVLGIALICCLAGTAQTTTTATPSAPLTPAQERAQARAAQQAAAKQAAAEKQAAAKQAAAEKQAAAKEAAAEKRGAATNTAATTKSANAVGNGASKAVSTSTAASTTTGTTGKSGTATSSTSSAAKAGTSGTVGTGALAWGPRVYSSTGCTHNGNSAVCTFTFVNQGNESTVVAGGAGELSGIQLVDDAHVPHRWASAHFLDKYGTQQPRLLLQPGDTGTYVVTFGDVNPQVSSAEFHLRGQIVGGITFGGAQSATAGSPGAASPAPSAAK